MRVITDVLLETFQAVAGRRLLGVVTSTNCIELVFEKDAAGHPCNLVSFILSGTDEGVAFGAVSDPEGYAERAR